MVDFKEYLNQRQSVQGLGTGQIKAIHLAESRVINEIVYEYQEVIHPTRDIVLSFFIPEGTTKIKYVYLYVYFPGLQPGDYPGNSPIIYLPNLYKGCPFYYDGAFSGFGQNYHQSGAGADGAHYWWYRAFQKFNISPLFGFKLTECSLKWLLASKAFAGAGANAQIAMELHAIDDYGTLDKDDWAASTQVDYGNVNVYTDPDGVIYSQDVMTRVQELIDALSPYAAFRFANASEPTDTTNANNYRINEPLLYCEIEENSSQAIGVSVHDGQAFGANLLSISSEMEGIDLTKYFTGTGKKQIKFTAAPNSRRIEIIIRMGIKSGGG